MVRTTKTTNHRKMYKNIRKRDYQNEFKLNSEVIFIGRRKKTAVNLVKYTRKIMFLLTYFYL